MIPTPVASAEDLARAIAAGTAVRWLDARAGAAGNEAYARGHVTGAVHAELERDLSAPGADAAVGGRHPLPSLDAWRAWLGRAGIAPDTWVAIYDDKGGAQAAARCWWMLRAVGHTRVVLLDGGWAAAEAAFPVSAEPTRVTALAPYPADAWRAPTRDVNDVARLARDPAWLVLDVRDGARYRGESEAVDPVAGHIPGSVSAFFMENLDGNGRFLPAEALRTKYLSLFGAVPPERVVVSCGSGVTACHTLVALERAGLAGASLYVGSYSEWCRQDRAIARGPDRG